MLSDLRHVCEHARGAEPEDFRTAAAALLKRQFLLLERPGDRDPYRLIVNHFDYFANLFDALGWTLHRDDRVGLVGLLPGDAEGFRYLPLADSLMLLCLRLIFEEGMERFEAREGSVYTQSQTLLGRYETLLGRKLPTRSDYREILRRLHRYSLIEIGQETEDGLPALRILPTVRLVTGDQVQTRIAAFLDATGGSAEEPQGEAQYPDAEDGAEDGLDQGGPSP